MSRSDELKRRTLRFKFIAKVLFALAPIFFIIGVVMAAVTEIVGLNIIFNIFGSFVFFAGGFLWLRSDPVYSKDYRPED